MSVVEKSDRVLDLIKIHFGISDVRLDHEFKKDLGFDSLDMIAFVNEVEKEFNIKIKDKQIPFLVEVGDTIPLLEK